MYGPNIPIMRVELLRAIQSAGVDDFELYDAIVNELVTGAELRDYKVLNVLGLVVAADMEKSTVVPGSESEMLDVDFDSLVIDPPRPMGFCCFASPRA